MTDIECIEYAVQAVLLKCRVADPSHMQIPPAGSTVMQWLDWQLLLGILLILCVIALDHKL